MLERRHVLGGAAVTEEIIPGRSDTHDSRSDSPCNHRVAEAEPQRFMIISLAVPRCINELQLPQD